jgi:hypothetical protein
LPATVILLSDIVSNPQFRGGEGEQEYGRFPRVYEDGGYFQTLEPGVNYLYPLRRFFMAYLSSQQALQLAADFALTAEYVREAHASSLKTTANLYETASRAAFLKAHVIAKDEEIRPSFGESFRRAAYAVA